ncbi:hypothetical protein AAMO2058_000553700 [Amorphochlora amoebiformis]
MISTSDEPRKCCGIPLTQKIRTLSVAFTLFLTIATAQLVGALIANSMALLADTASMFLDAATYGINIYAESQPKQNQFQTHMRMLVASGVSFFALFAITLYFLIDASMELASEEADDGEVNAYIVLGFALVGLVFDFASLFPYCRFGVSQGSVDEAGKLNMCSALSHIISDTMRSFTTLVESIVILNSDTNGHRADSVASIVVSALIITGILISLAEWLRDIRKLYASRGGDNSMENVVQDGEVKEDGRHLFRNLLIFFSCSFSFLSI